MCGVGVILRSDGGSVDRADLSRIASAIQHRGPDDAGFARLEGGRVGLVHVRLSVVDLAGGNQPIFAPSGSAIVFNGEVYEHARHRARLEGLGHRFHTRSDTEVLLHAYEAEGPAALSRLSGELAFAIWDARRKVLFAARDAAGVKPLFVWRGKGEVVLCSEVKGIFALGRAERRISRDYLTGPICGAYPRATCAFEGVEAIEPGGWIEVGLDGQVRRGRWFEMRWGAGPPRSFEDAKREVRAAVETAVRRRMVADVPAHAYLSGGLDSTIVTTLMARERKDFRAYGISFPGSPYDEADRASETARALGIDFARVPVDADALAAGLSRTVFHTEAAIANPGSVAKLLLSERVRKDGGKVCLTGEGSDEVFAGYAFFKLEALWRDPAARRALWGRFQAIEARSEGLAWDRSRAWRRGPHGYGFPSFLEQRARRATSLLRWVYRFAREAGVHTPLAILHGAHPPGELSRLAPMDATRALAMGALEGYVLPNLGDRVEMANALECRTPFLDRDVLDVAASLSPEHLLDVATLREKRVLHAAFLEGLPAAMRTEHKHPFMAPPWRALLRTEEGRALLDDHLSPRALADAGIYNPRFLRLARVAWRALPSRLPLAKALDFLIGTALTVQLLHRTLITRPIPCDPSFALPDRTPLG